MIRRARPGDAAAIRGLLAELGYSPDPRAVLETVAHVVRHPEAVVFVATEGLDIIGYVAMSHRPQMRLGGLLASVDELVVATPRRGERIGGALLDAVIAHARALRCRRIEVQQSRSRLSYRRKFYLQHGFVEAESALLRLELV